VRDATGVSHHIADRKPIAIHEHETPDPTLRELDRDECASGSESNAKRRFVLEYSRFKDAGATQIQLRFHVGKLNVERLSIL